MADAVFKTNLPLEEIENNFNTVDFFEGLKEGLEEALAYEKGKAKVATFARKNSLPVIDVKKERLALNLSQKAYASILGVSVRTVEAWECGRSNPNPTARNLMFLISKDPSLIVVLTSHES